MAEELNNKLRNLAENGLSPEEIIKHLHNEDILKKQDTTPEKFPDEIRIVSQALLFRVADQDDCRDITNLINKSYACETNGDEAFRVGDCVTEGDIQCLVSDPEFHWLLLEAPNGFGIEQDGLLLGVCCYTTTGVSRKNGEVEGSVGSLRFLGVLPRYRGLCVGLRLLQRVEKVVGDAGCCRVMVSVPSTRLSMMSWLERRGYTAGVSISYPVAATGHTLSKDEVRLVVHHKSLRASDEVGPLSAASTSASTSAFASGSSSREAGSEVGRRGLALPPHWRNADPNPNHNSIVSSETANFDNFMDEGTMDDDSVDIPDVD